MRHLAFLRVYLPLEKLSSRIHGLAVAATKLSRADIEAEAAQRLNLRLRPEAFSLAPSATEAPIIRVIEVPDPQGITHQYFHVNYLERAAFESSKMRREYYADALYTHWVPDQALEKLEKISEMQADAGLISRPVSTFHMSLWEIPVAWLAAFLGPTNTATAPEVSQSIIDGTPVVRRTRDLYQAKAQLGHLLILLNHYGPNHGNHPYTRAVAQLHHWLARFNIRSPFEAVLELDYGALSRYAWPDAVGRTLAQGQQVLQRMYRIDDELERDEAAVIPSLPPAMLNQAAEIMRKQYDKAVELSQRISRYEHAN